MEDDDSNSPLLRDSFDLNRSILFAALISVSTVLLLFMIYNLYVRCLRGRQAYHRHLGPSQLGLTTSGDSPLDPIVINSLPMFRFKQTTQLRETYDHNNDKSTECSVCLTVLKDEETVRVLPNCDHIFHSECVDKWLALHSTCPLCRIEAKPRVKPEPRERPSMVAINVEYSSAPPLAGHESRAQDLERG